MHGKSPPLRPDSATTSSFMPNASKILLVAWEAADWRILHPLLDAGHLPHLNRLVDRGVIAEPTPAANPHTLVNGQPLDAAEPDPAFRPVWQTLADHGRRCVAVRWPGSHPAVTLPNGGIVVSDLFRLESLPRTPVAEGSVEPTRLRESLEGLRLHPSEMGLEDVRAFVPELEKLDPSQQQPVHWLAGALADTATTHNAAVRLLGSEPWDFVAVPYTALGAICQQFLQFARVEVAPTSPFRQVAATAWVLADNLLGKLLEIAGPDATVLVCSSMGVLGTPMAVMAGPGVQEDERLDVSGGQPTAQDIVPTLRWLAGLPEDARLPGKAWKQAWRTAPAS